LVQIATYSQDHESYASLALLIKTTASLGRDLVNMHNKKPYSSPKEQPQQVTNNTLVLTTAEIQAMLEKKKNGTGDISG
jgi:hypothetical protein